MDTAAWDRGVDGGVSLRGTYGTTVPHAESHGGLGGADGQAGLYHNRHTVELEHSSYAGPAELQCCASDTSRMVAWY